MRTELATVDTLVVSADATRLFVGGRTDVRPQASLSSLPDLIDCERITASPNVLHFSEDAFREVIETRDAKGWIATTGDMYEVVATDRDGRPTWRLDLDIGDWAPLVPREHPHEPWTLFARDGSGPARVHDTSTGEFRLDVERVRRTGGWLAWSGDGRWLLDVGAQDVRVLRAADVTLSHTIRLTRAGACRVDAR